MQKTMAAFNLSLLWVTTPIAATRLQPHGIKDGKQYSKTDA
jgi:hypothetical protein